MTLSISGSGAAAERLGLSQPQVVEVTGSGIRVFGASGRDRLEMGVEVNDVGEDGARMHGQLLGWLPDDDLLPMLG